LRLGSDFFYGRRLCGEFVGDGGEDGRVGFTALFDMRSGLDAFIDGFNDRDGIFIFESLRRDCYIRDRACF